VRGKMRVFIRRLKLTVFPVFLIISTCCFKTDSATLVKMFFKKIQEVDFEYADERYPFGAPQEKPLDDLERKKSKNSSALPLLLNAETFQSDSGQLSHFSFNTVDTQIRYNICLRSSSS